MSDERARMAQALVNHPSVMYEPGLETPPEMKLLQALNAVAAGMGAGQMGGSIAQALASRGTPVLQGLGEAGAIFPEGAIPQTFRKADLMTPSEQSFASWEDAYNKHARNYDFENVLKDKWGMLKNAGGNH